MALDRMTWCASDAAPILRRLWILPCLLLGACTVGPDYATPEIDTPTEWTAEIPPQSIGVDAAPPPPEWWTTLSDPQLNALVERACDGNLDLGIASSRIREARARRGIASGRLVPEVGTFATYDRYRADGPLFPVRTDSYDLYEVGFDAFWEIDLFGGIRRSVEAAEADLVADEHAHRGVLVTVVAEVARNYVELRTTQQRLIRTNAHIATRRSTFEVTSRLHAAGITSDLDLARASAELTRVEADVPVLEARERAAMHQLSILLGLPPAALIAELQDPAPIPAPGQVSIGVPSELLRRRPDVLRAERQLAAATARIGVAEADLYPKVTLVGEFGLGSEQFSDLFNWSNRFVGVGPSVRWEIFQGGRILANVDAREAISQGLLDQYRQTILVALRETADALVAFNRRQQELERLRSTVVSSREAVRIARDRYAAGTIDYLSLLDAERSLVDVEDSMVVSQGEVTLSMVALYKAVGGGWEEREAKAIAEAASDATPDESSSQARPRTSGSASSPTPAPSPSASGATLSAAPSF